MNESEILIYTNEDGSTNIEVKLEDETVWLTQQQMTKLFQTSRTNVVEHIKNIYMEFTDGIRGHLSVKRKHFACSYPALVLK